MRLALRGQPVWHPSLISYAGPTSRNEDSSYGPQHPLRLQVGQLIRNSRICQSGAPTKKRAEANRWSIAKPSNVFDCRHPVANSGDVASTLQ